MIPFLRQVARKYVTGAEDISRICFVLPNRRSMAFFRKYISESVAELAASGSGRNVPVIAPEMLTINDFFYRAYGTGIADRVTLLLRLYDCYRELNPKAEPLDEFIFWGDVILADFNDVDKYLVNPQQLFTNVSDFREIQDTYSYLTENQRNAIMGFVSHFNDRSGRLTVDLGVDNPGVKARFLQIWNLLYPLYCAYNRALSKEGLAYEGMVYRALAERIGREPVSDVLKSMYPHSDSFVFVGLNALNECEKTLMRKMRDAGIAEFCWDYSGDMIRDRRNRSSFFMEENVREFPQSGIWDPEGVGVPKINVVSVPSAVGQVKMIPYIFKEADEGCAVVLPDETLLMPLLNSMPGHIMDINVTMGYPMSGSGFHSLMSDLSAMQVHTVKRVDGWAFYHRQVWSIFSSSIFRKVADGATMEKVAMVKENAKYYIPQKDLSGTALLDLLFQPVVTDIKSADSNQVRALGQYQMNVLSGIAAMLRDERDMLLELEFAREYYRSVSILSGIRLDIMPVTYIRLLSQLTGNVSVPFQGEPLKGFQVMGPLETRALDFRNLVIMSANEGTFPKRNVSSSFVPPELRRGFGMPTYEYQDAVWAYYFYRMITRAENVWLLYDSRTEGIKSGEESRYIKQLQYHFRVPMTRYVAKADLAKSADEDVIFKTGEDLERISSAVLSASALQNYLACPVKFYYHTVRQLMAENEVSESVDAGMFGTVYHDTMWSIYCGEEAMAYTGAMDKMTMEKFSPMKWVSKEYILGWLKRKNEIRAKVKSLICSQLNSVEVSGRDIVVTDVIVEYVVKTLRCDLEQIMQSGRDGFELLGLELKLYGEFAGHRFIGYVDRLDSFADGTMRVVDYKTGKVSDKEKMNINDENAEAVADAIFGKDVKDRPKIALQFYIYDMLLDISGQTKGKSLHNCVYSASGMFSSMPETTVRNGLFHRIVSEKLELLLREISDPEIPFTRTADARMCEYCDFKMICGR
ncbi:MAG: PD-(D/E)XK nuclease family protein [Bacteroidales bacterium]|nr:PD-(D/E)XK nuclease family protein [Bacteroidales bacterium]